MTKTTETFTDALEVPAFLAVEDNTRHWIYVGPGQRHHKSEFGGASISSQIKIQNGRGHSELTLDDASFELVQCPTSLTKDDFYTFQSGIDVTKSQTLQKAYYNEVEKFVKNKIGCDHVQIFHHQVRNQDKAGDGSSSVEGYATTAPHTDASPSAADQVALSFLTQKEGEEEQYERYAYLNLWRNISNEPVQDNHLAVLDERSTAKPDDYIIKDSFINDQHIVQYGLNARHSDHHKWYYFPLMSNKEAILLKHMDSDFTKSGRICFHFSVSDPKLVGATPPPLPRESIEVRMICYWKKADSQINTFPTLENTGQEFQKDPRKEVSSATLEDSSVLDLTKALFKALMKNIPGVGRSSNTASPYSGNPKDYEQQMIDTMQAFPSWPFFGKKWALSTAKSAGDLDKGIQEITRNLVKDDMGYQNTKHFKEDEKEAILKHLLDCEEYMNVCRKVLSD